MKKKLCKTFPSWQATPRIYTSLQVLHFLGLTGTAWAGSAGISVWFPSANSFVSTNFQEEVNTHLIPDWSTRCGVGGAPVEL